MPLISNELLRNRVRTTIPMQTPYRATENQKRENIASFHALSRDGLENGTTERRILLYETRCGEKFICSIQELKVHAKEIAIIR